MWRAQALSALIFDISSVPGKCTILLSFLQNKLNKLILASLIPSRCNFRYLAAVPGDSNFIFDFFLKPTTALFWRLWARPRYLAAVHGDSDFLSNFILKKSATKVILPSPGPTRPHFPYVARVHGDSDLFLIILDYNKTETHFGEPGPFQVSCSIFGDRAWRLSCFI